MSLWNCGERNCPGIHPRPGDHCPTPGVWLLCGSLKERCLGHRRPEDRHGDAGVLWDCGALYCYTHDSRDEPCQVGEPGSIWYCGQSQPSCGGHDSPNGPRSRCETGAPLLAYHLLKVKRAQTVLARQLMRILRQAATQGIDFAIGHVHVTGARFAEVAKCIEQGRIIVTRRRPEREMGVGGKYQYDINWLFVSPADTPAYEAIMVHEAVHAMNDLQSLAVAMLDDEAAAYIAEAWYYRAKTGTRFGSSIAGALAGMPGADDVVDAFRAPGGASPGRLLDGLRAAILASPLYQNQDSIRHYDGVG